jgi:peptidase M48
MRGGDIMEQDPRLRPMSREENAAYRGVTVDESGEEPQDEGPQHSGAYSRSERSSVRYVRIGGAQRPSLLTSFLWSLVLAMLLVLFFFVAFPAIVMVMVGGLLLWAVVSIIGRGRIVSWVMRKMYGR